MAGHVTRRCALKAGLGLAAAVAAPPVLSYGAGETPVKIGLNDPFTGIYAAFGRNEQIGCQLAVDQINAKGGILGRKVELLSEDSTSTNTGTAVQKAHKLIDRDKVNFIIGNVNSPMALAVGEVANQAGVLGIDTGSRTDAVTGPDCQYVDCHWYVFRVCNTTRMETNAVGKELIDKFGKHWYFITPDHSFGHTLQNSFEASLKKYHGMETGASLAPPGATDYSPYFTEAEASNPDVIIFLTAGQDAVNSLKQAVEFGLNKRFHIAGAQQELEVLEGLPPEARIGTWAFEWYWKQPGVPHVKKFVADIRKRNRGKVPTARHWFGYASTWTCYHAAVGAKSLDPQKMARFLQNWQMPPEVALMPYSPFFRKDHQLLGTLFVGRAVEYGKDHREDLFDVITEYNFDPPGKGPYPTPCMGGTPYCHMPGEGGTGHSVGGRPIHGVGSTPND